MRASSDHILTSHVGSLPRPDALIESNRAGDEPALNATLRARRVAEIVRRQREVGIDVPGDGEFGKPTGHRVNYGAWWNYSFQRLGGLDLDGPAETEPRRSRPGEIALTNAWASARPASLCRGLCRPRVRGVDGAAAGDRAGLRRPARIYRPRCDPARHRQFDIGVDSRRALLKAS